MSKSDVEASAKEQDEQKNDSVYDFLYYDKQRVGSFLAQFDASGHLQQITASEHASKGSQRGLKVGLGGSYLGTGANVSIDRSPGVQGSEGIERVYDPLWVNALALLDYLESADLICRDVTKGRLGQFVLASGSLSVLNPATLTKLWESKDIKRQLIDSAIEGQKSLLRQSPQFQALSKKDKANAEKLVVKPVESATEGAFAVFPTFPHSAQCTIRGNDFSLWSTLAEPGMVGTTADLTLKHGTEIPGNWNLLGILDAMPSAIPAQIPIPPSSVPTHFENMIKNFANLARTALGRPPRAHGATALLLFREVSAGTTDK